MADYTVTGQITSLTKRGIVPVSQNTFTTPDLIRIFDEELRLQLVPFIITVRENYFVDFLDTPFVSGQSAYQIAPRAIGAKLKNLYYVDAQGRSYEVIRIDVDDLPSLDNLAISGQTGVPVNFYFKDNSLVVLPTPDSGTPGFLRQYFYSRRNALVDTTAVGQITSINTTTGVLSLNNVPTTFTTSQTFDIVKGSPTFQNLSIDLVAGAVGASSVTFSSLPTSLVVGDYVCLAQESPIAQIPYEAFPLLVQKALAVVLRGINDLQGSAKAEGEVERLEKSLRTLLSDRADEQSKKIVSANNIGNWVLGRRTR